MCFAIAGSDTIRKDCKITNKETQLSHIKRLLLLIDIVKFKVRIVSPHSIAMANNQCDYKSLT